MVISRLEMGRIIEHCWKVVGREARCEQCTSQEILASRSARSTHSYFVETTILANVVWKGSRTLD